MVVKSNVKVKGTFLMDAGRDARERIETECAWNGYGDRSDLCQVTGRGSVEIRGSSIYLSIETVEQLSK